MRLHNRVVIVFIGLPGAGKSSLCRSLQQRLEAQNVAVEHIEIDALYSRQQELASVKGREFSQSAWRSAQAEAKQMVTTALQEAHPVAVMVDDNMFYTSMRKPYHRIAAAHGAAFVQVYVDVTQALALRRNSERSDPDRISEEIIRRMAAAVERPQCANDAWQRNSVSVDGSAAISTSAVERLCSELELLWTEPARVVAPREALDPPATAAARSIRHRLDIALRSELHKVMTSIPPGTRRLVAQELSNARRRHLDAACHLPIAALEASWLQIASDYARYCYHVCDAMGEVDREAVRE